MYQKVARLWQLQRLGDKCNIANGIGTPEEHKGHATRTQDTAYRRIKFYERMKELCNPEIENCNAARQKAFDEYCRTHPNSCA